MVLTRAHPAMGLYPTLPRLWLPAALLLGLGLALGGCATPTAQPRERVPLDVPSDWSKPVIGLTDVLTPLSQWWLRFTDAPLTDLVNRAMEHNTDIAIARAAILQAQANRDLAASALSPTLGASASAQRSVNGDNNRTDRLQAGLNAALDPDLSGALGRAVDASQAGVQAAQARLGAAQSQVAQAVALDYIGLRSAQVRLLIAQDNLASQLETLQITRWRNQAGLIGAVEVEQALVAAGQTRAQLPPLQVSIDSALHSLAVRVGQAPASLDALLQPFATVPQAAQGLAPGTPGEALELRPQVRAAKFDVEQALARADQARAARLPSLAFTANLGLGAATLEALSSSAAAVGALALSLAAPLLDGGAGAARVNLQEAALIQSQASYRAAGLGALQEVEDAMSSLRADRQHLQLLQQLALSAASAAGLAQQQFGSGLVDFQIVLETQRSLLSIQNSLALSWADVSTDQVRLYSALGGGWNPNAAPVAAKPAP
jgi:NodT family efflux transporter outer membrane factor (OMF) lipoprotein